LHYQNNYVENLSIMSNSCKKL